MSKIPLATPQPGTPGYEEFAKKKRFKKDIITALITLTAIALVIGVIVYLNLMGKSLDPTILAFQILSDAFGLAGILGIAIFGLAYVSSKGAFDILSYSVKLIFLNIFRPKYRKESFPKTFYDYKVKKDTLERRAPLMMLFLAFAYLAIGIIMLSIYNSLI